MSTLSLAVNDSATMLRRNLKHALRYPGSTLFVVGMPIVFLLLFVYVFGGAIGAGLPGATGGTSYINYLAPGIIVMTVGAASASTAVAVCTDMTSGIITRFRTMSIARAAVLTGHVVGSTLQTSISIALVLGVAMLIGFRPTAGPAEWIAAIGFLTLVILAVTWLAVALGLAARSPEGASNVVLPLVLLPFVSSAFVPTDSMPKVLAWFAEHQPFTHVIETLRGLLLGTPIGASAALAVAWCAGIALAGYLWARAAYNRDPAR